MLVDKRASLIKGTPSKKKKRHWGVEKGELELDKARLLLFSIIS